MRDYECSDDAYITASECDDHEEEATHLLKRDNLVRRSQKPNFWKFHVGQWQLTFYVLSTALVLIVLGIILYDPATEVDNDAVDTTTANFSFTLYKNGYDPLDYFSSSPSNITSYNFLADYVGIVEPNAEMKLQLYGIDDSSSLDYKYTVCTDSKTTSSSCYHGSLMASGLETTISISCSVFDTFQIVLIEYLGSTSTRQWTERLVCLYIRREIQSLTSEDLNKTMDAMYTLWSVSEAEGQAIYGDNYHASSYFVQAHEFNSAQPDSDHMHEGIGFLPQHIKLTNMFELAVQAVDASVSVPYWDFTVDRANGLTIFESSVFTALTFGTLRAPVNTYWGWTYTYDKLEDARIQDGRWQYIKVDQNVKYPELQNSYGTVRGLWTLNPSEFVSRFTSYSPSLPSCSAHYSWLALTDLTSFFYTANNGPHASTHGAVAATYGCDVLTVMTEAGYLVDSDAQLDLCSQWGFVVKDLYRASFISAKSNCTATSYRKQDIQCGFVCSDSLYDDMPAFLESEFRSTWTSSTMGTAGWEAWRDFICDGEAYLVFFGDHLDPSVSPSDPSFWPLHPTLERVLHAKYMTGGFEDPTWPSDAVNDFVCTLAECYEGGVEDYHEQCCFGHYENDQMLDFVTGNSSRGFGDTNAAVLKALDPRSSDYSLPYIYDNFKWDHCVSEGYDFDALMSSLASSLVAT